MAKYLGADNLRKSGKADLTVNCRNGVSRDWVYPVNTFSTYKQFQIDSITIYSFTWQSLSQSEMMLWHQFHLNNKNEFNQPIHSSGMQAFISCNYYLALVNADNTTLWISEPPINGIPQSMQFTFTADSFATSIQITNSTNYFFSSILISTSVSLSAGIFKPRQCEFRNVAILTFPAFYSTNIYSQYFARYGFGFALVVGQKIFIRCQSISNEGLNISNIPDINHHYINTLLNEFYFTISRQARPPKKSYLLLGGCLARIGITLINCIGL